MTAQGQQQRRWTDQEREALRMAREYFPTRWRPEEGDVSDVHVWLEGEPGSARVGVIFKHRGYPGCMFGARGFPVAGLVTPGDPHPSLTIIWANIDEDIDDASDSPLAGCKPGEVTWI